jgi:UDP-N-acetylglucosamine 4-epimerase
MNNLTILVTGGAGFIGSNIVEFLLNNSAKYVRILDNLSTGSINNIEPLIKKFTNMEFIWGDITNLETCRKACNGISLICHQAALGSVPESISDPLTSHNINVNGFLNILIAAKDANIKRIIFASSSSVYGSDNKDIECEDKIGRQLSPYAITKYIDELYAKIFTELYGLECIGLRYFNVFGPKQNPNGVYAAVIPKFIKMVLNNKNPTINGDGTFSRDFTYIDNVVYANYLAMITTNKKCFGEIFNVGTNSSIDINTLFNLIKTILCNELVEAKYGPKRIGDVPYSNASTNKIMEYFGYSPKIYFDEGLKKTVEYFRKI